MKLTIELVPKTQWYTNVRSNVSSAQWDIIRRKSYEKAGNVCEICGDTGKNQGVRHNVECHEIWEYDDEKHLQKLTGFIALCPYCHKVKHPGLASINGETPIVMAQLMKVNEMTEPDAQQALDEAFTKWRERSEHQWELDITYVQQYIQ